MLLRVLTTWASGLLHLALMSNPGLNLAGLLTLSGGLKVGHAVSRCRCTHWRQEGARVGRAILNTCIRNTDEAECVTNSKARGAESSVPSTPSSDTPPLPSALGLFSIWSEFYVVLIRGTSTPLQSVPTQKSVVWEIIDESWLVKGVQRREKEQSIGERVQAVVKICC